MAKEARNTNTLKKEGRTDSGTTGVFGSGRFGVARFGKRDISFTNTKDALKSKIDD